VSGPVVTRADRLAAVIAYNGPDSVGRHGHPAYIESGEGGSCTLHEIAEAIAKVRAEVTVEWRTKVEVLEVERAALMDRIEAPCKGCGS
jgi:hypothetical protein